MAIVTKEKLENADIDVDDLAAIVNGSSTVSTRLGGDKFSVDQALSQIIVGQVTVYSAAATYANIEDWVEFSGAIYRPLPSQLPIGPEAFNSSKWAVVQPTELRVTAKVEDIDIQDGVLDYTIPTSGISAFSARFELASAGGSVNGTLLISGDDYTPTSNSGFSLNRTYPDGKIRVTQTFIAPASGSLSFDYQSLTSSSLYESDIDDLANIQRGKSLVAIGIGATSTPPTTLLGSMVETFVWDSNRAYQWWHGTTLYYRIKNSGVWGAWVAK